MGIPSRTGAPAGPVGRSDRSDLLTRRQLLGAGAAAGLGAIGAGTGAAAAAGITTTTSATARGLGPGGALLPPGSRPFPHLAAGTDTIPQLDHIVVLMMENHSFDDHLGMLGRGDGLTLGRGGVPVNYNPDPEGGVVTSFHMPTTCAPEDSGVSQSWDASHISWAGGTNQGFVKACGPDAMGYWTGEDLPYYYALARQFPIGDRYFASVMAQTYPNRRFLIAATALGNVSTDASGISVTEPPNGTIFDTLDAHGISWKDYYPDVPTADLFLPVATRNAGKGKIVHISQFFTDAASGTLPSFSLVDPYTNYSEEDNDISVGEAYAASVINAVMAGPAWERTALIWIYDEHGGWYDHVPPAPAVRPDGVPPAIHVPPDQPGAYDHTGFRVPCAVVSAWSRPDYVSHHVYDHTSVLKLVETKWNLPALTYRDANAGNMLDFFDLTAARPPFAEPPTLPAPKNPFTGPLPAGSLDLSTAGFHPICLATDAGTMPPASALQPTPAPGADALMAAQQRRFAVAASAQGAGSTGSTGSTTTTSTPDSGSGGSSTAVVVGAVVAGAVVVVGAVLAVVTRRRRRAAEAVGTDTGEPDGAAEGAGAVGGDPQTAGGDGSGDPTSGPG